MQTITKQRIRVNRVLRTHHSSGSSRPHNHNTRGTSCSCGTSLQWALIWARSYNHCDWLQETCHQRYSHTIWWSCADTMLGNGLGYVKYNAPDTVDLLVYYFDLTCVSGCFRRIQRPAGSGGVVPPLTMGWTPLLPLSPSERWNCHETTPRNESRTNNLCES